MPRGEVVFDGLPAGALVIDALVPAVFDGAIVVRKADQWAVVICRNGAVSARFASNERLSEQDVQSRPGATAVAVRLSGPALDLLPLLLGGETVYADLRQPWADWSALLDDLRRRGGSFVVVLETPDATGVVHVRDGAELISFTDGSGAPDDVASLVARGRGTITVMTESSVAAPAGTEPEIEVVATPVDTRVAPPEPPLNGSDPEQSEGYPEVSFAALFGAPPTPPPSFHNPGSGPDVASMASDLKLMARSRLELSAPRLEQLIDNAALQHASLPALVDQVRSVSIRGVTAATLDRLADEMLAAGRRTR